MVDKKKNHLIFAFDKHKIVIKNILENLMKIMINIENKISIPNLRRKY